MKGSILNTWSWWSSLQRGGPVQAAADASRESHKMALDKKGMACCYWDARQDLINPGWVTCARRSDVEKPKTSAHPRNITDDACQRIHRGVSYNLYNTCFSNIDFWSRAVQKAGKLLCLVPTRIGPRGLNQHGCKEK